MARHTFFQEIVRNRSRLQHVERDLRLLRGETPLECKPAPLATDWLRDRESAMGSIYVMEGSTLGGEIIAKVLSSQPWCPPGGLHYFAPPGRDIQADWAELRSWANGAFREPSWPAVAAGARETFSHLDTWLLDARLH